MAHPNPMHDRAIDRRTVRQFWQTSRQFKHDFYRSWLMPVSAICLYTVMPFIVGKVLSNLVRPEHHVTGYLVGLVITGIIGVIANRIGFSSFLHLQPQALATLQADCLTMLLKRGTAFHNNQVSGKLVTDASEYAQAYQQLSNTVMITIIPFVLTIVSGLIVITVSSPILGALMIVMSAVAIGSGIMERQRMIPHRMKRIAASRAVTSHFADTIVNVHAVKTFAREAEELTTHQQLGTTLMEQRQHDWRMVSITGSNRIASLLVFEFIFILLTVWLVDRNPQLLAAGIFAFSYTITLANRLFDIGSMVRGIEESLLMAEPITSAMLQAAEVQDQPDAPPLVVSNGLVAFADVNFHYSDDTKLGNVFHDLSFTVQPGERVGLIGPSGGGKSTVTKLLLRFEDIQSGAITIDNQNIAAVSQTSLRQAIAYVPQESLLFHRTIAENIAYGNPTADINMIMAAAQQAYAHDFIMDLPNGYDTTVGERGVKLSGGQRQRVAIARAILKNAPILVLDEATSALDSESEQYIQDALWQLMKNKTALVIAHRLSTIQKLDRIIVLENGQIIETGSHAELLKQNGLYARLWKRQSGGFIEE